MSCRLLGCMYFCLNTITTKCQNISITVKKPGTTLWLMLNNNFKAEFQRNTNKTNKIILSSVFAIMILI